MNLHSLKILVLILSTSICFGQNINAKNASKQLKEYLPQLQSSDFHGTILVGFHGKKIISKGYGFRDIPNQLKNTSTTVYDIGSLTKQFTAAAILILEEQGKLSVQDSLSKFFPNLPEDKRSITLHDLLRHQSGLKSTLGGDYEKISEEDFLSKVFASELQFPVGTSFGYSNIGYSVLALLIEKVSQQSYESFLYDHLWKPAKMRRTGYARPHFPQKRIAIGYNSDNSRWGRPTEKPWDGTSPYWHLKGNGGLLSTPNDLFKWDKALSSKRILNPKSLHQLVSPPLRDHESVDSYYAYGWDVSKTTRHTTEIWHNGTNRIFYADFLRFPDEHVTLILLSNRSQAHVSDLNFELANLIFIPNHLPENLVADNPVNRAFTDRMISTLQTLGLEKAKEAFEKREKNEFLLEFFIREEGFRYIDQGRPELATSILEWNALVFPTSAKALQGLGECYLETGKKELALKTFQASLRLNPENKFVRRTIQQLEKMD